MKTKLFFLVMILALLASGCRSKKKLVEKKVEKVSVLEKKDIKSAESIKADVSIISVSRNKKIKISPEDPQLPSRVIFGKDTLSLNNAKVEIEDSSASEKKEDKTESSSSSSDKSSSSASSETGEKKVDIEKTGVHSALIWGGLLLLLLVGAFFYFRKKIPFL
jgi:LPXTG-motif cell wall-anchored protein